MQKNYKNLLYPFGDIAPIPSKIWFFTIFTFLAFLSHPKMTKKCSEGLKVFSLAWIQTAKNDVTNDSTSASTAFAFGYVPSTSTATLAFQLGTTLHYMAFAIKFSPILTIFKFWGSSPLKLWKILPKTCSKKINFDQNCEHCSQFSVFEATSLASYDPHL